MKAMVCEACGRQLLMSPWSNGGRIGLCDNANCRLFRNKVTITTPIPQETLFPKTVSKACSYHPPREPNSKRKVLVTDSNDQLVAIIHNLERKTA